MVESKEQNLDSCRKSRISPSLNKMLWFLQWRFKCYQKKKKKMHVHANVHSILTMLQINNTLGLIQEQN